VSARGKLALAAALGLCVVCLAALGAAVWVGFAPFSAPPTVRVSTSIPTGTPVAQAMTPTLTPRPTDTLAPVPSPAATGRPAGTRAAPESPLPTPTPAPATDTPEPTPTPWIMPLRDDLPPLALSDWPRPAGDNGWGMHFLASQYYTPEEVDRQVGRLTAMRMKWALVVYGDENMLRIAAPRFRDAGIMVVWRRMLRADDRYYDWGRDIGILAEYGMAPYMQIYNEPNLAVEWDEHTDSELEDYLENFLHGAQDVYNAGGYVGIQHVREDWLEATLDALERHGGERVFGRMFFIPHPYALNHPPEYDADVNAMLGFLPYARVFERELGFVPPMIAGEGGWAIGSDHDANYPKVTEELHRDYFVALYDMFRTGMMPNGDPLPDYFFAFCPWLLSDFMDSTAFYDSYAGDRLMTIEAIQAIPPFERRFGWMGR
jgi:hypothetical protein